MTAKTLYVFRGPCGGGKTWLRTHLFPKGSVTIIDMEEAPRGSYDERVVWLKAKLKAAKSHVALEGIFAPGSPSWNQLQDIAPSHGFHLVSITIVAPRQACLDATKDDPVRTRFVEQYYDRFT